MPRTKGSLGKHTPTEIFCSGGGVNSAAIIALIIQGRLPRPAFCVIADTERERPAVWLYHNSVILPACNSISLPFYRIPKSKYAKFDLWSQGKAGTALPVYHSHAGRSATHCSNEWKRRTIDRFCKKELGIIHKRRWIGLALEEGSRYHRWKFSEDPRLLRFPLIDDIPTSRQGCFDIVQAQGWPPPPRSMCIMCPLQNRAEWAELKRNWPDAFQQAASLEQHIQTKEPNAFLSNYRIPLAQIDFDRSDDLFDPPPPNRCNSGLCFT